MAIRHKRTTTTGYTWQSGDTVEGQIGLNITDGTLHFKKSNGTYVSISEGAGGGIDNVVEDTTPQLGGNLDVNGNSIVSTSNGNITLAPNGTGKVVISGDLQIDGTTTTVNSTTLDVDDINITIAKGAANAAAADGGGITLEGPTTAATITYASADDSWNTNKKTSVPELQVDNININGSSIISTNTNGNITIAPNGTGDIVLTTDTVNINENTVTIQTATSDASTLSLTTPGTTASTSKVNIKTGDGSTTFSQIELLSGSNGTEGHRFIGSSIGSATAGASLFLRGHLAADGTTPSAGSIIIPSTANGNITIQPDGTGDILLNADTVRVGDTNAAATITTNGTGDLTLNTNSGTSSGSIAITNGANGNITIAPNGTGVVSVTGLHVGTITSTAGSSPITGRHTAIASNSIANVSLNAQKHRTDIALASMTDEPAVVGFSVRDNTNTNRNFGRLIGRYQGTGTNPNFTFQYSTDGFTTTNNAVTIGGGVAAFGATNSAYTLTTNGTGNLTLNTNNGTNSGSIVINQGVNGNISITPNGTGIVVLDGINWPVTGGTNGYALTTNGSNQASWSQLNLASAVTGTLPVANGGTGATSAIGIWNTLNSSYTGINVNTSLTTASTYIQHVYGGTNVVVTMPAATSMNLGHGFVIYNTSGTTVTVNTSAAAAIATVPTGMAARFWVNNNGGNLPANWTYGYTEFTGVTGTGSAVLSAAPTITGSAVIGGTTFPSATGTTGQVLTLSSAGTAAWTTPSGGGAQYALITGATTFFSTTKYINWTTEDYDANNLVTVGSNGTFTISNAGTYLIQWITSHTMSDPNTWRLYNQTGSAVLKSFTTNGTSGMFGGYSYIDTITASRIYRWECPNTGNTAVNNVPQMLITKIA
jgi:hypothetical protein